MYNEHTCENVCSSAGEGWLTIRSWLYVGYNHINASIMQAKMATTLSLVSPLAEAHIRKYIAQALSSSSALLDTCTLAQKAVGSSMINAWEQK